MKKYPWAIFLDIDGTLITDQDGPFAEDLEPIEEAHRRGNKLFLSTGRSLAHIPQELREAPWLDGIIAGAGAQVLVGSRIIHRQWIPEEILPDICEFYLHHTKFCVFEGETGVYGINLPEKFIKTSAILGIEKKDDLLNRYNHAVISKLTIEGSITGEEREFLENYFQLNTFHTYFEGILRGENKAKGMAIILEAAGIPRENSIAIGDSANDIDIVRAAGIGIAMGNASDDLKAVAREITGDCGKGGVGGAIKRFVLG